jgi:GNAT superfamily N-acetyltransferase
MSTVTSRFEIVPLEQVPDRVGGVRQELNQLWYGPSEILIARRSDGAPGDDMVGAVRLAMRERPARAHGLIADLIVDEALRSTGLPEQLIQAAEARLKAKGAEKIDALTVDGRGWASYYYRCGYWSSRRTVVLNWDLQNRKPVERSRELEVRQVDHPDPELVARFIINSYQPYFRWWKEPREDQRWDRVELLPEERQDQFERANAEVRQRVVDLVRAAGRAGAQTYFLAYRNDELVGLCDAKDAPEDMDTFDWCVLVTRQDGGKGIGSTLLDHALAWLQQRGRATAEYTSTSGLDDYDPLIYLATVGTGAQIRGEFLDLVKTRL